MNRSLLALPMFLLAASLGGGCTSRENSAAAQPGYGPPPPQYGGGGYQQYPQQPGQPPQQYPQQPPQQYPQQPGQPPQQYPQQPPPQQQPGQPQQQPGAAPGGFPFPFPIPGFPAPGGGGGGGGGGGQPPPQGGGSGGSAQPLDPNMAQAATIGLFPLSQQHARGMQKVAGPMAGNFQQGQTLSLDFQLTPGKCYVAVGNSQGISELDLQIVPITPLGPGPAVAQDQGTGSSAVIGGGGQCWTYQAPFGATGRLIMTARTGGGLAAAEVYMR